MVGLLVRSFCRLLPRLRREEGIMDICDGLDGSVTGGLKVSLGGGGQVGEGGVLRGLAK